MYRRSRKYQESITQFARARAAREEKRIDGVHPEYPPELPDLRRSIEITDYDTGTPVTHRIELYRSNRIDCYRNQRTSQTRLWLSERFELTTTITGMLAACRKSLTQRSDRSGSPEGRSLKPPSTVSAYLKRASHFLRTLSCIRRLYRPAEKVPDLFAGSYKVWVNGKLWKERIGWSKVLEGLRKALPRRTSHW